MQRTISAYLAQKSGPLAVSDWIEIDQARVDAFAAATYHDHWLHTDPVRAATESSHGGTLAHGFLVLSLINHAIDQCGLRPSDSDYALNYGVDKVRFVKPMPIGNGFRVRDRISLLEADMRDTTEGAGLFTRTAHAFDMEGDDKPCVVAEYLSIWLARD